MTSHTIRQASIASCGHEFLPMAWAELDAELQYVCTAGFATCACFAPIPVYRGFGACVLGDWDWACPDMAYLEEKARKKAIRTVYGFKQKVDAQPARAAFAAFDSAIQMLQVKPMAFLEKRPLISSFAEQQPRYGPKPKKEVKDDIDWLEDWLKQLERRGHPAPRGTKLAGWGIPYATWTSPFSCHILKSAKDVETIVSYQMDPGRLLHAFVCRGNVNLDQGQLLLLLPRSPAESLMNWLEGLPGTSHKIVRWHDLDTEYFEKKLSKSLRKKIGQYPLPTQYAIRDAEVANRPSIPLSSSSPALLEHPNTVSPPPYSPSATELRHQPSREVVELGSPGPRELAANPVTSSPSYNQHSASLPVPGAATSSGLKSIHTLRRKTAGATPSASSTPPALSGPSNTTPMPLRIEQQAATPPPNAVELHEETLPPRVPPELPEPEAPVAVELPTDFQSEAPRPLAPKAREDAEASVAVSGSGTIEKSGRNEDDVKVELTEEPSEIGTWETNKKLETIETNDVPQIRSSISPSGTETGNQYLELLNKVAKGEISPQALGEILQKGKIGQNSVPTNETMGAMEAQSPDSAKGSPKSPQIGSLPYPLSPTERQTQDWQEQTKLTTDTPYLEIPTETSASANPPDGSKENDIPPSLRPGH